MPTRLALSRKAMRSSPNSRRRTGLESGCASSLESIAGIQYWRIRSPVVEPGPTRVNTSLSSLLSMVPPGISLDFPFVDVPIDERVERLRVRAAHGGRVGRHVVVEEEHDEGNVVADGLRHLRDLSVPLGGIERARELLVQAVVLGVRPAAVEIGRASCRERV